MKAILILTAFILVACGDQGAIDRAVAAEIRMRAEAEIESTRIAQGAELAKERAEWSVNGERNVLRRDLLLFSLSIILVLLVAFAGFIVLARIWNTSKGLSQAIVQKAEIQSKMVRIDSGTMTWPALVDGGAIHQLDNGRVLILGQARGLDAQSEAGTILIKSLMVSGRLKDPRSLEAIAGTLPVIEGQ